MGLETAYGSWKWYSRSKEIVNPYTVKINVNKSS
jgi:hypothetical protein